MARFLVFFLLTLAIKLDFSISSSQHMVCKTVDSIFSEDADPPHSPRPLQGPPGKRGFPGAKGQDGEQGLKGDRGDPGVVNLTKIENSIQEKVNASSQSFRNAIANLQTQVQEIKEETGKILCEKYNGFRYQKECYFSVVVAKNTVALEAAKAMCASRGSKLADILDGQHQTAVENHLRENIPNSASAVYVWVGLTYSPSTSALKMFDGSLVSSASFRWYPNFPNSSGTAMGIQADENAATQNQGLFNYGPQQGQFGALCVKN